MLVQAYEGKAPYRADFYEGPHRLFVALSCQIEGVISPVFAMADTAAEWCVLSAEVVRVIGLHTEPDYPVRLETRLGTFHGLLERIPVRFTAEDGEPLTVEATWFVCPDWPGPLVLGWKGCLERFRFALDPGEEMFYFGG